MDALLLLTLLLFYGVTHLLAVALTWLGEKP